MKYFGYTLILLLFHQYLAQDKTVTDKDTKNAVEELVKNINDISVQPFSNASLGAKQEMLQKVERKLKKAAKSLGKRGEKYVKLIMKGIKSKTLSKVPDDSKTVDDSKLKFPVNINDISEFKGKITTLNDSGTSKLSTKTDDNSEIVEELSKTPDHFKVNSRNQTDNEDINQNVHFVLTEPVRRMNIVFNGSYDNHIYGDSRDTTTKDSIQSLTPSYECEGNLDKICLNIKQMNQLKCHFDDSVVPLIKLCDGLTDCIDRTDEKFCTSQVTERLQNANQVIYQTEEYFELGCFANRTKDPVMTSQIIILRSVLQAQQEFTEKYKYLNQSLISNSDSLKEEGTAEGAVHEISLIISSLALALDAELCSHRIKTGDEFMARKFNDLLVEDFDKVMDEVEWPPKSCICDRGSCENITICTNACKRVCWQKYSLTRWGCPSINETENVPISVICDGKFDCFDQSDEKDCVTGKTFAKYEAHKNFKDILNSLTVKVTSKEYAFIRNMLLSLHSAIENLQKYCMASVPDLQMIRVLRNKCFSTLSSMYSETLSKSSFLYQKSEVYLFLLSLNENIVNTLKLTHTGNKRIISNESCYCKNGRCTMPVCSRNCLRSCIAEPWLTRYFCENSSNKSVSLDDICNGKPNCPEEDDEAHCEKDICRRHHLTVLRHDLQNIGKKREGTSMGELLNTWKIKVSSTLMVAEKDDRPTPNTIREVIKDILNDLVTTYGAVKDYRRDNEYALVEFTNIARYIMKSLRSCGY